MANAFHAQLLPDWEATSMTMQARSGAAGIFVRFLRRAAEVSDVSAVGGSRDV